MMLFGVITSNSLLSLKVLHQVAVWSVVVSGIGIPKQVASCLQVIPLGGEARTVIGVVTLSKGRVREVSKGRVIYACSAGSETSDRRSPDRWQYVPRFWGMSPVQRNQETCNVDEVQAGASDSADGRFRYRSSVLARPVVGLDRRRGGGRTER